MLRQPPSAILAGTIWEVPVRAGQKQFARARILSDGYWLQHCGGYRVDSPDGRVGVVEHVCLDADSGLAAFLAVRCGLFVPRSLIVPVGEVEGVIPRERRVVLRGVPQPTGIGLLDDLWGRLPHVRREGRAAPRSRLGASA
jgi:hypothetical protein